MNSVRLVESLVEKKENITWHDEEVETFVIAYRNESVPGDSNRKPAGYAWVMTDGLVVRQELTLGNARIRLERMPAGPSEERAEILESGKFEKYVHRHFHKAAEKRPLETTMPKGTGK